MKSTLLCIISFILVSLTISYSQLIINPIPTVRFNEKQTNIYNGFTFDIGFKLCKYSPDKWTNVPKLNIHGSISHSLINEANSDISSILASSLGLGIKLDYYSYNIIELFPIVLNYYRYEFFENNKNKPINLFSRYSWGIGIGDEFFSIRYFATKYKNSPKFLDDQRVKNTLAISLHAPLSKFNYYFSLGLGLIQINNFKKNDYKRLSINNGGFNLEFNLLKKSNVLFTQVSIFSSSSSVVQNTNFFYDSTSLEESKISNDYLLSYNIGFRLGFLNNNCSFLKNTSLIFGSGFLNQRIQSVNSGLELLTKRSFCKFSFQFPIRLKYFNTDKDMYNRLFINYSYYSLSDYLVNSRYNSQHNSLRNSAQLHTLCFVIRLNP